ncbi:MAG: T9SS type A sorting domain-containing protein [Bacteroidetes bacterium]|nr:T9SS type A sorting domain-containing protein [Bacteroidota bacterium]
MKLLKFIFFIFLACLFTQGKAQTLQIDNVQASLGDTASASVNFSNIDSVGSITLFIGYDTTKLKFVNYTNLNPVINGAVINDMHNLSNNALLGKIAVSWAEINSVNFHSEIFVNLNFKALSIGNCPITFFNNCELANSNGQVITINYLSGSITVTGLSVNDNDLLDFKIYPNPSNGIILIEKDFLSEKSELQLYSLQGKIIYSEYINNINNHLIKEINLTTFPKGIYFVKISNNQFVKVEKVIIQ